MFNEASVSMGKLMFASQMRVSAVGVLVTLSLTAKTNCMTPTPSQESLPSPCITCLTSWFVDSQTRAKCHFLARSAPFSFSRTGSEMWGGTTAVTASIRGTMLWKSTPIRSTMWKTSTTSAVAVNTTIFISARGTVTGTASVRSTRMKITTTFEQSHLADTDSHILSLSSSAFSKFIWSSFSQKLVERKICHQSFFLQIGGKQSETGMTASFLKQDPSTEKVQKNAIY